MLVLLDLFCGAGGVARGYADAGFEVVGVDIAPQKNYPYEFHQGDALEYLDSVDLSQFSVIHASPPCQRYTTMLGNNLKARNEHPDFLPITRVALQKTGLPYIIENVAGSPLIRAIMLCGGMFEGLRVYRHRYFESNIFLFQPHHFVHKVKAAHSSAIPKNGEFWSIAGHFGQKDDAQKAMGINWMKTAKEIANAIPPAYTHFIGLQLINFLEVERADWQAENAVIIQKG